MPFVVGELAAPVTADTKPFAGAMKDVHRMGGNAMAKLGQQLQSAGRDIGNKLANTIKVGAAAAGAAITGLVVKGTMAFSNFQGGMNEVFTLMPGISGEAMQQMSGQVKQFAKDFKVLPEQVVPALYQSISAGVPADNVLDFLATSQKAAVGGVTSLETAVDGISSVVNAYGADVLSATQASDLMFTAVKLGKTNFEQLAGSLYNVVPTAQAVGVQFGDITAALAAMTAQGTPTSVATTQLRQLLVELSKDGTKTSQVFKEIAGKSFKQFVKEGGNTLDALLLLEKYAERTDVGINDLFGSVEAGNAALALTGKGTETFRNNIKEMGQSAGATEEAYRTMDKGIGRAFEGIKSSLQVALINVGERMEPVLTRIAEKIQANMPKIERVFEGIADAAARAVEWVVDHLPEIERTFQSLVDAGGTVIGWARDAVTWFNNLSPPMQEIIVKGGIAAAVLGKTGLLGAVGPLIGVLNGPAGLVALMVALAAALDQISKHVKAGTIEKIGQANPQVADVLTNMRELPGLGAVGQRIGLGLGVSAVEKIVGQPLGQAGPGRSGGMGGPAYTPGLFLPSGGAGAGMGGLGEKLQGLTSIPGLAGGGEVRSPGLAFVGEEGTELLRLPRGATVVPLPPAAAGGGVTININGPISHRDDVAWVANQIVARLRDAGVTP